MFKYIDQVSEQAFLIDFGSKIDINTNSLVVNFSQYIQNDIKNIKLLGIKNCVPSYNKILIQFDPFLKNKSALLKYFEKVRLKVLKKNKKEKLIEVPICYDDEFALDLNDISKKMKLSKQDIIKLHLSKIFHVFMIGFMPGLPFLGIMDERFSIPRKSSPRQQIKKGSVGIVNRMCVIYPNDSPGGWNIIGRTPIKLFFQNKKDPLFLKPNNKLQFKLISKEDYNNFA